MPLIDVRGDDHYVPQGPMQITKMSVAPEPASGFLSSRTAFVLLSEGEFYLSPWIY